MNGPVIPGMCFLSNDYVLGASAVGKYVINRLNQLKAQVEAELNSQGTTLQADVKALEGRRSTLTQAVFQQKAGEIQQRGQTFQNLVQQRNREMQATQEKAFGYVAQQAEPAVRQIIAQRSCSILLNGSAVVAGAPSMDISPAVVQQLDTKVQKFEFNREQLEATAGGQ